MDKKKKLLIAILSVLALFLLVSSIRYFMFSTKPPEQTDNIQQEQDNTQGSDTEGSTTTTVDNLGDMSALNGEQKTLAEVLITTNWMDSKGNTLSFTTSTITQQNSGSEERKTQSLTLGAVQKIENTTGETTNIVACISIDGEWTLLNLRYGSNVIPVASAETGQIVAESGSTKEKSITISSIGGSVYKPNTPSKVEVLGIDNVSQAIDGSTETMTLKIQDFCRIIFPTATTATWTGVEHVLYEKDQNILYFKLNDSSTSMISVLYQPSSGNFEVQAGEKTEFSKGYTTPEVS